MLYIYINLQKDASLSLSSWFKWASICNIASRRIFVDYLAIASLANRLLY